MEVTSSFRAGFLRGRMLRKGMPATAMVLSRSIGRRNSTRSSPRWLTGKPLSGREAAAIGLINRAVPFDVLESTVRQTAMELASIPLSQLAAMKLVVNQAYENMGLASTQTLGPILDGLMRNTPEALEFIRRAKDEGVGLLLREGRGVRRLQPSHQRRATGSSKHHPDLKPPAHEWSFADP
jgi:hypothetical protein